MPKFWELLPDHLKRRPPLTQGSGFRIPWKFETGGQKLRYFFVINRTPEADGAVWTVTSTTNVENCRRVNRQVPETVVEVSPTDYTDVDRPCAIDCNYVVHINLGALRRHLKDGTFELLSDLPKPLLKKVLKGIQRSRKLSPRTKKRILGD